MIMRLAVRFIGSWVVAFSFSMPLFGAPVQIVQEEGRVRLASDGLQAEFVTVKNGGICSLTRKGDARNLLMPPGSWFAVNLWNEGETGKKSIQLYSHDAGEFTCTTHREGDDAVLVAEGTGFPERGEVDLSALRVRVIVRLEPQDEALRWRCEADVPKGLHLQRFEAPLLQLGVPFGGDGKDDAVVIGHPKGGVGPDPANWKERQSMGGVLSAQFGCAYDAAGGIMTMACDGDGYEKQLYASRTKDGLYLSWRQAVTGTGTVAMPYDTLVRPFAGEPTDWRDAADIYRAWALKQRWCEFRYQDRPDVPDWMKAGPSHVRFGRNWLAEPEVVELWLKRYWDPYFSGIPLAVTFWGWEKHGSWVAPDYFPPYPSAEAFAKLVKSIKQRNGHVFLWPSGYHWTVSYEEQKDGSFAWDDRARFDREGMPHVSLDANGKPRIGKRSWLRGGMNASMCPGDPWTRQWFDDICRGCLDIGADMIQVDQVVRGAFPDCFSTKHGHAPGGGLWKTQAVDKQLREILDMGLARTRQFVLGIEEPQEWFNHLVGIQDYRDFQIAGRHGRVPGHQPASVYGYVYHDFLPVFQSNPRSNDPVGQGYCLVTGQIPHFVPTMSVCSDALLLNGSFDKWQNGAPRFWSKVSGWQGKIWKGTCSEDKTVPGVHGSCLLLENPEGETVQVSQNISVSQSGLVPEREYQVSIRLRSEGVQPGNNLKLGAFAPGLRSLAGWQIPVPVSTDGKWQDAKLSVSMPKGTVMLRIMLHLNGAGKVWLDDMTLKDTTPKEDGKPTISLPNDHEIMRQWSHLFHGAGRPWLLYGQMIHPPRLETASIKYNKIELPAVLHNAFRSPDGKDALVLVNVTAEPQTAVLHTKKKQELSFKPYEVRLLPL
jgi:hypothetical protein